MTSHRPEHTRNSTTPHIISANVVSTSTPAHSAANYLHFYIQTVKLPCNHSQPSTHLISPNPFSTLKTKTTLKDLIKGVEDTLRVLPSYLSQIQERPEDSLQHQER